MFSIFSVLFSIFCSFLFFNLDENNKDKFPDIVVKFDGLNDFFSFNLFEFKK
jgi:hypothetical protein